MDNIGAFEKRPACCGGGGCCLCVMAVFVPPLAVMCHLGTCCLFEVLIDLALWCCGIIPGIVYAWFCILTPKQFTNLMMSFIAVFLSPVVVLCIKGCGFELCLNILLWCCAIIPGFLHGLCIIWTD